MPTRLTKASLRLGAVIFLALQFAELIHCGNAVADSAAGEGRQLSYATVSDEVLGLPPELTKHSPRPTLPREIPGRHIPAVTLFSDLNSPTLINQAIPLPEANTLAHINFQARRFGRMRMNSGEVKLFNPETILVKFRGQTQVAALRVETNREWDAVQALSARKDVEFAELDTYQTRQYSPNDPLITNQWHHQVIGSAQAWNYGLGNSSIRIAIVDTPFQMDHPDLAANTVSGWDVVANVPVTSGAGIVHSTICAGMAAAVINNGVGVAGAVNCQVLPININGAISEMYNATIWAANHGVRVVNISWTGGTDDTLEAAGYYLKTNTCGILVMSAYDGTGPMTGTNQPDIYCISMTDAADNVEDTQYGSYIDFAAPGWQIYSTTIAGGYASGSGTSYAAPLFCGVVAGLFSINPTLQTDEVINILKSTAVPLGSLLYYGSGRINFAAAAAAATGTLPNILNVQLINGQAIVSANFRPGLNYSLWRTPQLNPPNWISLTNTTSSATTNIIFITDPSPLPNGSFYRVNAALP
jgi:subtilisin family serine protease